MSDRYPDHTETAHPEDRGTIRYLNQVKMVHDFGPGAKGNRQTAARLIYYAAQAIRVWDAVSGTGRAISEPIVCRKYGRSVDGMEIRICVELRLPFHGKFGAMLICGRRKSGASVEHTRQIFRRTGCIH